MKIQIREVKFLMEVFGAVLFREESSLRDIYIFGGVLIEALD